jgi:putative FmdB family regulatory protein
MPIYDYRCDKCGSTYDVLHKVREVNEDVVCPSCGSKDHTRLLSAPMVNTRGNSTDVPACGDASRCGGACPMN